MKGKLIVFLGLAVLLLGGWSSAWAETAELPADAAQVVENFLTMLDQGKYRESYSMASILVTKEITRAVWGSKLTERADMGELKSRKQTKVEKIDVFGDLPKGEYLEVSYGSNFTENGEAEEIIVLNQDADGYKIAGYQINYNRWPEALKIMVNGVFLVFLIMIILATITWAVGKMVQAAEKKKKASAEKG
jgi:hypothetical protein